MLAFLIFPLVCYASHRSPSLPVIAVDFDEVLANFVPSLAAFHNHNYNTTLTIDDFGPYYYQDVWGGSLKESNEKMTRFYNSSFFQDISPIPNAKEVLESLKNNFDLHIVTARPLDQEEASREWIDKHYHGIFKSMQFGNHFSVPSRSKSAMCRDINAFLLIDDSYIHAKQCMMHSHTNVILFGDYPWNSFETNELIPRAKSWDTVYDTVLSIYADVLAEKQLLHFLDKLAVSCIILCSIGLLFIN